MPCSDYYTDLKSVLDQTIRILQAMIDVCAENGWLKTVLNIINLMQMVVQGRWANQSSFLCLPHVEEHMIYLFKNRNLHCLPQLWELTKNKQCEPLAKILRPEMDESLIDYVFEILNKLPQISVDINLVVGDKPPFLIRKNPGKKRAKIQTRKLLKRLQKRQKVTQYKHKLLFVGYNYQMYKLHRFFRFDTNCGLGQSWP